MGGEAAAEQRSPVVARRRPARSGGLAMLRAQLRLPRGLLFRRALHALKRPWYASALYHWTLDGHQPTQLLLQPPDPWPGEAGLGQGICRNRFNLAGRVVADPAPFWLPEGLDASWWAELHGFAWLRDLRALGGDSARRRARDLAGDWVEQHRGPGGPAWEPATTGRRIANCLAQFEFFAASAELAFQDRLLDSLARQTRHLHRILPAQLSGADLIAAAKGLVYAGVCLPESRACLRRGLAILEEDLPRQILADGCHIERSPAVHMAVLRDLIDLRAVLAAARVEAPRSLSLAIEGMTPVLKLFRHGDGGLALFNGSQEGQAVVLDMAVQRAASRARAQMAAPQSGFQRLQCGRTLVLVDAGRPPPPGYDSHAHAGTLSFEMSHGRSRIIVNCGAQAGDAAWSRAQRATAAHSTLSLAERNSSEVLEGGGLGRRPGDVVCRREEGEGAIWLDMSHDGYRRTHGCQVARRLYLASTGDDLRGQDIVMGPLNVPFAIRFHLHPEVSAVLAEDGRTVRLRSGGGSDWRLQASGAEIALEESVYLGSGSEVRRSAQVVLQGRTAGERTTVKWALKREVATRS